MLNTHREPSYMHWKHIGNTALEDFDYMHTKGDEKQKTLTISVSWRK